MNQPSPDAVDTKQPLLRRLFATKKSNQKSRWMKLAIVAVVSIVAVAVGVWRWYADQPIIDQTVALQADFSVYAPTHSLSEYQVKDDQTTLKNGVLTYVLTDESDNETITITVQPRPSGFDMAAISKSGSLSSTLTNSGTLYNLSVGGNTQYLLNTGDSLVYITSPREMPPEKINSLVASFEKVN